MDLAYWLQIIVPSLAALFVVFSFWWLYWRKGRLVVSSPRSFRIAIMQDRLIVELPLSFYNTGAVPIIIDNLLLRLCPPNTKVLLRSTHTQPELESTTRHRATQIAIDGRKAIMNIYSFQGKKEALGINIGTWDCCLLGKLDGKTEYAEIAKFKLNVIKLTNRLLSYDNYADEYKKLIEQDSSER